MLQKQELLYICGYHDDTALQCSISFYNSMRAHAGLCEFFQ